MAPVTRLALAQQAHEDALRAARERSTPQTWARLLRTARNLREASADGAPPPVRHRQPDRGGRGR